MVCPKCRYDAIERSKRKGFLEKKIFSLFGYYPWRCEGCSTRFFLRVRYKLVKRLAEAGE
jgi:DNA-directed RNA polymerase subunit RPC12/RpoP